MNRRVSTNAATPTGTLIQKIARQSTSSTSPPPTTGPKREREADHAAPDADRLRPLAGVLERVADDRHRDGVEHRAADALQHPEDDQQPDVRRDGAEQRAEREERQADLEHPRAADPVGRGARQHQQAGEHQRVGGDGPLQLRGRRVQVAPQVRQRDVHGGVVEPDDEEARAADREDEPAARVGDRGRPVRPAGGRHGAGVGVRRDARGGVIGRGGHPSQ